jgi:hypothetical protein
MRGSDLNDGHLNFLFGNLIYYNTTKLVIK